MIKSSVNGKWGGEGHRPLVESSGLSLQIHYTLLLISEHFFFFLSTSDPSAISPKPNSIPPSRCCMHWCTSGSPQGTESRSLWLSGEVPWHHRAASNPGHSCPVPSRAVGRRCWTSECFTQFFPSQRHAARPQLRLSTMTAEHLAFL